MVETRKRRIGLIYIELYYWTSISFLSILEGRAILSQLVEFGSEISLESYGILRLIDVPYFAQGIVIHIFLRDAHLTLGLLPKFHGYYLGRYVRVFSRRFSQLVKYFWFFFILIIFDTYLYFFIIIRFSMFYFLESSLSCYYYHFFLSQLCFYNNKTIQNK